MTAGRAVVIGVGNPWAGDDGVGSAVVEVLRAELPAGVELFDLDGEPGRIIDAWDGAPLAVVVDGIRLGEEPGTVRRVAPEDVRATSGGSHAVGLGDAWRLGTALRRLPARLVILGVEVGDVSPGHALTPAVAAAVPHVVAEVRAEIGKAVA